MQREEEVAAAPSGSDSQQQQQNPESSEQHPDAKAKSAPRANKVYRTYGQKKAKPDASADVTAATLSSDFLALIGGHR